MKKKNSLLLAPLLAALLAGCLNPAMFKKGAYAVDDWESWTGWNDAHGSNEARPDGVYYTLAARQDDTRDEPSDGYAPGLIISREMTGERWRADLEADFNIPAGAMKRFSYGVWVGGDAARPSIGSASGSMKIIVQRQNGPRSADDSLIVFCLPGARPFALPKDLKVLRFERDGNFFSVSYAMKRGKFTPVFRLDASSALPAPSQKLFVGGFSGGDPQGAYMRLKSLRINDKEVLR